MLILVTGSILFGDAPQARRCAPAQPDSSVSKEASMGIITLPFPFPSPSPFPFPFPFPLLLAEPDACTLA